MKHWVDWTIVGVLAFIGIRWFQRGLPPAVAAAADPPIQSIPASDIPPGGGLRREGEAW